MQYNTKQNIQIVYLDIYVYCLYCIMLCMYDKISNIAVESSRTAKTLRNLSHWKITEDKFIFTVL